MTEEEENTNCVEQIKKAKGATRENSQHDKLRQTREGTEGKKDNGEILKGFTHLFMSLT